MSRNTEASSFPPAHDVNSTPQATSASRDFALVTTFAALIALCAILPAIKVSAVPTPITLQTFGVMLAGLVLGPRLGAAAAALYLLTGAIGLPVFSGGTGGVAVFLGPTAGYLVSFPFLAAAVGALSRVLAPTDTKNPSSARDTASTRPRATWLALTPTVSTVLLVLTCLAASYAITHLLGILGMAWRIQIPLLDAFLADAIFIPGDVIKTTSAVLVASSLWRAFPSLKRDVQ